MLVIYLGRYNHLGLRSGVGGEPVDNSPPCFRNVAGAGNRYTFARLSLSYGTRPHPTQ